MPEVNEPKLMLTVNTNLDVFRHMDLSTQDLLAAAEAIRNLAMSVVVPATAEPAQPVKKAEMLETVDDLIEEGF